MSASILCTVASYTMVKAVRDAVFLAHFGLTELSLVYIGIAASAGLLAALGTWLANGHSLPRVILGSSTLIAGSLIVIWGALSWHLPGTAWVLYLWSSFFGLFLLANSWLLANQLFNLRAAGREFPWLAAGAILGGIVGGQVTELASRIGTVNLLPLIAVGFLVAALLASLAHRVAASPINPAPHTQSARFADGFALLRDHHYLRRIASLLVLVTLVTTLLDLQVKAIAKDHFHSNPDAMAVFFGRLTKTFSAVSLGVQLLVTPSVLKRFGAGGALLVLPGVLALSMIAMVLHAPLAIPILTTVAMAKIGDGSFRFSLDKSAMELLYVPVPLVAKTRAKPVIDTVADRSGTALTGIVWLVLTSIAWVLRWDVLMLSSLAILVLLCTWVVMIRRAKADYTRAVHDAEP